MNAPIDFKALAKGLLWSVLSAAGTAAWSALYNYVTYSNPIDWKQLTNTAMAGAMLGAAAWWKTHQALFTAPPGTVAVPFDQLKNLPNQKTTPSEPAD